MLYFMQPIQSPVLEKAIPNNNSQMINLKKSKKSVDKVMMIRIDYILFSRKPRTPASVRTIIISMNVVNIGSK